jgi:hypothetical protein
MDWLRLPLRRLCQAGLVVGWQKCPEAYLSKFCNFIAERTHIDTRPIAASDTLRPGRFYLGNPSQAVELILASDPISLGVKPKSSLNLPWYESMKAWLGQLAEQAQSRLCLYLLSAAQTFPPDLIERLLNLQVRLILAPRQNVMCKELVDSIQPYAEHYPRRIVWGSPETLMEVWLNNGHNI